MFVTHICTYGHTCVSFDKHTYHQNVTHMCQYILIAVTYTFDTELHCYLSLVAQKLYMIIVFKVYVLIVKLINYYMYING